MQAIYLIFLAVLIAYIWFKTDAFIEYMRLFEFKFFKYEEYENEKSNFPLGLSYQDFILFKFNNFFIRLISCPICLLVWINLLFYDFFINPKALGLTIIGSWIGYFTLVKLIKKLNE